MTRERLVTYSYLLVLLNGRTALRGNSLLAAVKCGTDLKNSKFALNQAYPVPAMH